MHACTTGAKPLAGGWRMYDYLIVFCKYVRMYAATETETAAFKEEEWRSLPLFRSRQPALHTIHTLPV